MIKNVVFDFGQVMIRFEAKYMVEQYVSDAEDSALLQKAVFNNDYWPLLDEAKLTNEQFLARCFANLPERLHADAERIYYHWIYHLPPVEGMRALVQDIKRELGVRVFLLSNISAYFASHADEIEVLGEFEKCIFSGTCGHLKPHADMYEHLCRECGIRAEETVFVDDNADNIRGANEFGLHGYHFDGDASKLRAYLYDLIQK